MCPVLCKNMDMDLDQGLRGWVLRGCDVGRYKTPRIAVAPAQPSVGRHLWNQVEGDPGDAPQRNASQDSVLQSSPC